MLYFSVLGCGRRKIPRDDKPIEGLIRGNLNLHLHPKKVHAKAAKKGTRNFLGRLSLDPHGVAPLPKKGIVAICVGRTQSFRPEAPLGVFVSRISCLSGLAALAFPSPGPSLHARLCNDRTSPRAVFLKKCL